MYQRHFAKGICQRILYTNIWILIILALTGCGNVPITVQTPVSDIPSPINLTPPRETQLPTITPSSTTASQLTWTPVATLPMEIRRKNLIEMFETNGGCYFPCWWGVSLGDPIQKAHAFAPIIGESFNVNQSFHYYTLSLDNLDLPDLDIGFYINDNNIIENMEILLREPSRFKDYYKAFESHLSLTSILSHLGKPSDVLFLVQPRFEPGETPRSYTLFIIYELQDFGIAYSGLVDSENPLQVCSVKLDTHYLQSVSLYFHEPHLKIKEINRFNSAELFPIEEVTSMNLEEFYRIFSNYENNQCIEVSLDPWQ